jgi:hypothetical protein
MKRIMGKKLPQPGEYRRLITRTHPSDPSGNHFERNALNDIPDANNLVLPLVERDETSSLLSLTFAYSTKNETELLGTTIQQ